MTAFSRTASDTAGGTDSATRVVRHPRTGTDTAGGTDAAVVGVSYPLALLTGAPTTAPYALTLAIATTPTPTPAGQSTQWGVLAVDRFGVVYADYPTAVPKTVRWTLGGAEGVKWAVPIDAANLAELPLARAATTPHREVQLWRNGHMLVWAVPTARQANSKDRIYTYDAKGLLWYYGRRYMGRANRHNFLTNASFESGLTGWSAVGGTLTATADSSHHALGPTALKLVQTNANLDEYEVQSFVSVAGVIGLALFYTAWIYLDTFTDIALNGRGVGLVRAAANVGSFVSIDANTPTKKLIRLTGVLHQPPNVTEVLEYRVYGVKGTMWVDAATVTAEESISLIAANSPGGTGWDQIEIPHYVSEYLQGRGDIANAFGVNNGKSDLNIGFYGPPTGITKERTYQFFDHQRGYAGGQGAGVFDEFSKSADGFDIRVAVTPNTRTLTCEYPRTGTDRPDLPLTWVKDPTNPARDVSYVIAEWDWAESIEQTANQVVELGGWGTGASREEGGYENNSALGGLTLEMVESAPNDTPIDALDTFARQRGLQYEHAVQTPIFTLVEPRDAITGEVTYPLIGVLLPGDTMPVRVDDGDVQMDGTYRLVTLELDCTTEQLKATFNPEPV